MQRFYRVLGLPAQRIVDADDRRQFPIDAEIQVEYAAGSASYFSCSPSGIQQPSSSKTKWALPMMTFLSSTITICFTSAAHCSG